PSRGGVPASPSSTRCSRGSSCSCSSATRRPRSPAWASSQPSSSASGSNEAARASPRSTRLAPHASPGVFLRDRVPAGRLRRRPGRLAHRGDGDRHDPDDDGDPGHGPRQRDGRRDALARKGAGETFDGLMEADARWRELETRASELRAETKTSGKPSPEELERLKDLKATLQQIEAELAEAEEQRQELLARVPNPPDPSVPDGDTEEDAVEVRRVGDPPTFSFQPRDHLELAEPHGWIDLERAARISGSRFAYRVGEVALLELALYRFALDRLVARGFVPVLPPVLVREE